MHSARRSHLRSWNTWESHTICFLARKRKCGQQGAFPAGRMTTIADACYFSASRIFWYSESLPGRIKNAQISMTTLIGTMVIRHASQ